MKNFKPILTAFFLLTIIFVISAISIRRVYNIVFKKTGTAYRFWTAAVNETAAVDQACVIQAN